MKTFFLLAACAAIGCGSHDGAAPPAPEPVWLRLRRGCPTGGPAPGTRRGSGRADPATGPGGGGDRTGPRRRPISTSPAAPRPEAPRSRRSI